MASEIFRDIAVAAIIIIFMTKAGFLNIPIIILFIRDKIINRDSCRKNRKRIFLKYKFPAESLKSALEDLEKKRKKMILKFGIYTVIATVGSSFYSIIFPEIYATSRTDQNQFYIFIPYLFLLSLPFFPIIDYKSSFKKQINPVIADVFGYRYEPAGGSVIESFRQRENPYRKHLDNDRSILFGYYNSVKSEDGFYLKDKECKIGFEEINLGRKTGDFYKTLFKGVISEICLKNTVAVPVVVFSRKTGIIGNRTYKSGGFEKIELEDPKFEKMYSAYSTDQIEARKVLRPAFMEILTDISALHGNCPVSAALYGDRVFIAVETYKDMFEVFSFFIDARDRRNTDMLISQIAIHHKVAESLEG